MDMLKRLTFERTSAPTADPHHPYRGSWEATGRRCRYAVECDQSGGWAIVADSDGREGFWFYRGAAVTLDYAWSLCQRFDDYGPWDMWTAEDHGGPVERCCACGTWRRSGEGCPDCGHGQPGQAVDR